MYELSQPNVSRMLRRAWRGYESGDWDKAKRLYNALLQQDGGNFDVLHGLRWLHYQRGRLDTALVLIQAALKSDLCGPDGFTSLGLVFHSMRRLSEALVGYEAGLDLAPDNTELLNRRGVALIELNRPREAFEAFERILALQPDHLDALGHYGNVLLKLNRLSAACQMTHTRQSGRDNCRSRSDSLAAIAPASILPFHRPVHRHAGGRRDRALAAALPNIGPRRSPVPLRRAKPRPSRGRVLRRRSLVSAPDWLSATIRRAAVTRALQAGQTLFRAGGKTVGLYEILEGKVRLVRVDRSGREAVLQVAGPGDTLAEASLFASHYHCDAIATTAAIVRLYPRAILVNELERNPKLAQAFAAMLARQVMTLRTRLEQRNIHSARDRVRHYLAINADSSGRVVRLAGTLKDIAAELGLTHEALYRTLAEMAADGEIERRKGTIRLLKII